MTSQPDILPPEVPDDLHLIVLAWQRPSTRDLALSLADDNRRRANTERKESEDANERRR